MTARHTLRAIPFVLIAFTAISALPARADFIGQQIEVNFLYPELSPVFEADGTQTITAGGVSFSSLGKVGTFVTGSEVQITNIFGQNLPSFAAADYNGIQLTEVGLSPATITGVAIDPATNIAGFGLAQVSFTANNIILNLAGLSFPSNAVFAVDLTFNDSIIGAPEPSSVSLLGIGLAMVVFAGYRRRKTRSQYYL